MEQSCLQSPLSPLPRLNPYPRDLFFHFHFFYFECVCARRVKVLPAHRPWGALTVSLLLRWDKCEQATTEWRGGGLREGGGISKGRVIRGKGGENREGGEAREAEEGTRRGRWARQKKGKEQTEWKEDERRKEGEGDDEGSSRSLKLRHFTDLDNPDNTSKEITYERAYR